MKRFLLILITIISSLPMWAAEEAGAPVKIWTYPTVYRASDQVTWYFDMTDTKFTPGVDLFIWTWAPSEPDAGNWESSSDFAKLTYEGDNIYSFTFVPADYYGVSAELIDANDDVFWGRLKTKDGGVQSDVFQVATTHLDWQGFINSGEAVKSYPEKFLMNEPFSILVDISKFTFNGVVGELKNLEWQSINFHSGLDDWSILQEVQAWIPKQVEKTKLTHVEGDIYRMDMIPMDYYGVESDYEAENIQWLITTVQPDWVGTGDGPTLKAAVAVPYPDPTMSFFPQKFCALDILSLIRRYNGKTDGELTYIITAGSKIISGTMTGNRDKREATIDLQKELKGTDVSSIKVTITNINSVVVTETTLPLVSQTEITYE